VLAIESGEILALSKFGIVFCRSLECVLENFLEKFMFCNKFLRFDKVWPNSFANFLEECMFSSKILKPKSNRILL
jgi:hypothetical protein